ncbi:hypothetical protein J3Q64DRAFT_1851241 [Phycomyces blakesleeanus]|uniref:Uncharacterized protein n=1 Tax=Phycomyces blakesleeanus TaxID=4837 RepID=A0ABR3ARA0_PHYBL
MDLPPIVKTFVCTRLQDTMITSTDYTLCFSALVNMMISELRTSEFFFDNNDIKIKKVPGQKINQMLNDKEASAENKLVIQDLNIAEEQQDFSGRGRDFG